ncbi:hypothetical protein PG985_007842 [Apiospora marii]|uniref:uncharacterized protein n=1 Tax=Apiospora marii TaxID=335849 RepID=UPI00312CFB2B
MKATRFLTPVLLVSGGSAQAQPPPPGFPVPLNSTLSTTTGGAHNVRIDTGTYGPPVEEYHYFYDQWPIGLAVSRRGRVFTCYTRGDYAYTLGEVVNLTAEAAYPSQELNTPPDGLVLQGSGVAGVPFGSADSTHFISVQALYVTPDDTLWVLDTGRPTVNASTSSPAMPYAAPGGPKLVAVNLTTDTITKTYTFPADVHYPDSYMNDLRFDLRANATETGKGVAYIVDSSDEGRNGFIVLDLGTGESWRQLDRHPSTLRVAEAVPAYQGLPFYLRRRGRAVDFQQEGLDGAELSLYGDVSFAFASLVLVPKEIWPAFLEKVKQLIGELSQVMYYSPLTSNYLYSIETKYLRANPSRDPRAVKAAFDNVKDLGQRGGNANGFAGDSLGNVYMLMPEHNAVFIYNSTLGQTVPFVRDPRIIWPDSANAGWDGYLYLTINQLPYQPNWNDGVDGRAHPGLILRARMPDGAAKSTVLA